MNNKPITVMYLIDTCVIPADNHKEGGAERQLYLLATSLDTNTFRSIVVQLSPSDSLPLTQSSIGSAQMYHFPMGRLYGMNGIRQLRRIYQLAKNSNVDIVHTFFEKSEVVGWLIAFIAGIPVWVTSRRDLGFKRKTAYSKLFRFSMGRCKKYVANCNAVRNQMVENEGLAIDKTEVIYNGIDLGYFQVPIGNSYLRRTLGIAGSSPLVGMIANFNFDVKGHRYFLEAAKQTLERSPEVEFILVGDGPLRGGYEELAQLLGIADKVHFLGKRNDVASIIATLSVSVLCSTSEGLSNVILETMALGKPVVATRVGGSPELVIDGVTGYLVPPADSQALSNAVVSILNSPDKGLRMGSAARDMVERQFTVQTMVRAYENLYNTECFSSSDKRCQVRSEVS